MTNYRARFVICLAIAILSFISIVSASAAASAGAAAAVIASNNANNAAEDEHMMQLRSQSPCAMPFEYAEETNCTLKYPDRYEKRVGAYRCGDATIIAACNGTVLHVEPDPKLEDSPAWVWWLFGAGLVIILLRAFIQ